MPNDGMQLQLCIFFLVLSLCSLKQTPHNISQQYFKSVCLFTVSKLKIRIYFEEYRHFITSSPSRNEMSHLLVQEIGSRNRKLNNWKGTLLEQEQNWLLLLIALYLFDYTIGKWINIIILPKKFYELHVRTHQVPARYPYWFSY